MKLDSKRVKITVEQTEAWKYNGHGHDLEAFVGEADLFFGYAPGGKYFDKEPRLDMWLQTPQGIPLEATPEITQQIHEYVAGAISDLLDKDISLYSQQPETLGEVVGIYSTQNPIAEVHSHRYRFMPHAFFTLRAQGLDLKELYDSI